MKRRVAFTLAELLVVLGIGVILLSIFVPYVRAWVEGNRRVACQFHLSALSRGLDAYAADNGFYYPRTRYDASEHGPGWTAFTGAFEPEPFANTSRVEPADVSAGLWLLVRQAYVPDPTTFVCPSSGDSPDPLIGAEGQRVPAERRGNFLSAEHLSYGYAVPYSPNQAYKLTDSLESSFVLMADAGPGAEAASVAADADPVELSRANSPHHGGAGQSVLYAGGRVVFAASPYVGVQRRGDPYGDNIYTALAPDILIDRSPEPDEPGYVGTSFGPAYDYDSYLVPWVDFEK